MKLLYKIVMIIGVSTLLTSCYYDTFPEDDGTVPEDVSYSMDIQPLWDADCVSCHNGAVPPNLEADVSHAELLNGFVVAGNPDESVLYHSLLGTNGVSLMPPNAKWPDSQINLVKGWIEQGAKDN